MNTFLAVFTYLLAVGSVLFLAYVLSKYLSNKSTKLNKGRNINVIDSISIGLDKWLILVKAGKKVLLLCSCGKNVQLLSELNENDIQLENQNVNGASNDVPSSLFARYLNVFKNYMNIEEKHVYSNNVKNDQNNKHVFNNNLEKLKNKFSQMQGKR